MVNILRPVGHLEKASTSRHSLGFYRSVANTATYSIPISALNDENSLPTILEAALAKVILRHPNLCCGILGEDTKSPAFARLDEIDVRKRIEYEKIQAITPKEYDGALMNLLAKQHSQLWPEIERLPPWKIVIFQPAKAVLDEGKKVLDVAFFYHHGIGDGMSGVAFHLSFLPALNAVTNDLQNSISTHNPIVTIPESLTLLPSVEDHISFTTSYAYLISKMWDAFRPSWLFPDRRPAPWTGGKVTFEGIESYKVHARLLTIPAPLLSPILNQCRKHHTTLTCLIHALTLASLAALLPSPQAIKTAIPYSLRPWSKTPRTEITVQVCNHPSHYEEETISALRKASTNPNPNSTSNSSSSPNSTPSNDLDSQIWTIASTLKSNLSADLATIPKDNLIGVLSYVSDWHKFYSAEVGLPRKSTFEVSNVGVLKPLTSFPAPFSASAAASSPAEGELTGKNEESNDNPAWTISRDIFTQCASVTGEALNLAVASVIDGPLAIGITWQDGVLDEELVQDVMKRLERMLVCIGEGEKISAGGVL
ncbi:hypothetical protein B7463_g3320, partial [Scytalidium lignicola]